MHYGFEGMPTDFSNTETVHLFVKQKFSHAHVIQPAQVHGSAVVEITQENKDQIIEADGVWTTLPDVVLSIKTADCLGILFYHPEKNIIAAIHSGWRGLAQKISSRFLYAFDHKTIEGFQVSMSPSLGLCCSEFTDPFRETPDFFHPFVVSNDGKFFVDLWSIAKSELINSGVYDYNIMLPAHCTKCSGKKWWSHRNKQSQRNLSYITLL